AGSVPVRGERLVRGQVGEQLREIGKCPHPGQRHPLTGAGRESPQVPGDVLTDIAHPLVLAVVLGQEFAVSVHDPTDLAQRRRSRGVTAVEARSEFREQPRPSEAAATDHDARAPGLLPHADRVLGGEDVAVAQDRHVRDRPAAPEGRWAAVRACRAPARAPSSTAIRPASRWVWCSSSIPTRIFTVTGMSVPSVARTAAATIERKSRRLYGIAEPPPRRVTLGTGQPKLMSM